MSCLMVSLKMNSDNESTDKKVPPSLHDHKSDPFSLVVEPLLSYRDSEWN